MDDLNTILEEATPLDREVAPELLNTINNIDLLDKEEISSKSDVKPPSELLEQYTEETLSIHNLNMDIENFKKKHENIFKEYQAMLDEIELHNKNKEALKLDLTKSMEQSNLKILANNIFKVTFVAATTKTIFDRKKFEAKYPVLCQQFLKQSNVSSYIKITEVKS